ncbi:Cytochrome P450 [Streptomyces sp. yr375]|uniref:cytochrome P450 n=1 Tax=Streptomyces sp. yr375 TaxID=1761906 RepID=UPI0008B51EB8|nr:cytochrome P450 [Streptomyces sp. yr375]SEQ48284.1 Cytochrome P450 [Streptomyces sp. yr375]
MTQRETTPPRIPVDRAHPLDPPPELAEWRARCPVAPLTYADGHEGWIVTNQEYARQVLSDPRFSSDPRLRHSAVHDVLGDGQPPEEDVPGMFVGMDPPEHTTYRRLLTGELSTRRMREMEPKIAAVAHELVDRMRADGATGADLVTAFAIPLPSRVICDLLGIEYEDWREIQPVSEKMLRIDSTAEEVKECYRIIFEFLGGVVELKRKAPADDLLSGLAHSAELSDVELTSVAFQLFTAGHETTANMFSLGTYTLLTHPEQLAALRESPDMTSGAVEEMLRYLTVIQFGISRGAAADVELGGATVRAGQTVTVSLPAANRDPERFADPDRFDITRVPSGNLAFGFGVHQCVAQQLARAEMRIGFQVLFDRLPELRLAVPAEEVAMREGAIVYGCRELPVTW